MTEPWKHRYGPEHNSISSPSTFHPGSSDSSTFSQSVLPWRANASRRRRDSTRSRTQDPYGLTLLYEPQNQPSVDLIFVHGPGGGSQHSWMQDERPDLFWPLEWLPAEAGLDTTRIYTFGYNTQVSSHLGHSFLDFTGWAKELLHNLRFKSGREDRAMSIGDVPIILVSHGLGGLVAKKAYLMCKTSPTADSTSAADAMSAFLFFSTPHGSVRLPEILKAILSASMPDLTYIQDEAQIWSCSQIATEINESFRDFAPSIDTVSFYETRPTWIGQTQTIILRKEDATIGQHAKENSIPLNADHISITKFGNYQDSNYIHVRDALRYLVEKVKPSRTGTYDLEMMHIRKLLGEHCAPEDDLAHFLEKRMLGTCEDITNHPEFTKWSQASTDDLQIIWCYGNAGCGKSVTASHIIESLKQNDNQCAYYYFRAGDEVKNSLSRFVMSLTFQLAQLQSEYRQKLCHSITQTLNPRRTGHKDLWKTLIVQPLSKARFTEPLFITVDGIDELGSETVKHLLTGMFSQLTILKRPIRLLIVSRPLPDIESSIKRLCNGKDPPQLPIHGNEKDLEIYVQDAMDEMFGDDYFKQMVRSQILERANGNFLWVQLVVKDILKCMTEDDVERALRSIPEDLNPLYVRMDRQLGETFQARLKDKQLGTLILGWALCSKTPLSLEELSVALSPEHTGILNMRRTVQILCGDFVMVDRSSHVRMMHASARDFLLSRDGLNYSVHEQATHQRHLAKCMQKLSILQANMRQALNKENGFFRYSAMSWPFHLDASDGWLDQGTLTILLQFLQQRAVLDWIFVLASTQKLRVLVEASKALTSFLKKADAADQQRSPLEHRIKDRDFVRGWANDLIRIVGKFGGQLVMHPKAIYDLIPIFCPSNSAIYKMFTAETAAMPVKVRGALSTDWDDCLARFVIPGSSLPMNITSMEKSFSVLTDDGTVRMFSTETCELIRSFKHNEPVLAICFNEVGDRFATYGYHRTIVWDTKTAQISFSVENPCPNKAMTMVFKSVNDHEEELLTFSDDSLIRSCATNSMFYEWSVIGRCSITDLRDFNFEHANAPRSAQFNRDGSRIVVAYRGVHPLVFAVDEYGIHFVSHCERRLQNQSGYMTGLQNFTDAATFSWDSSSGYLLGIFNDGCIFKWHPDTHQYYLSEIKAVGIKCSVDGKVFATNSSDGTLRIWDLDHFQPIYQLSHPQSITDLAIDRNEARIYDIREGYCNVWQPNSLLRLLEPDDKASETRSSRDSTAQTPASEEHSDGKMPITTLTKCAVPDCYIFGNDAGFACLMSYDGSLITNLQITDIVMSVEHIACCASRNILAIADLSRDINIRRFTHDETDPEKSLITPALLTISEAELSTQLLFNYDGTLILIVTASTVKIYEINSKQLIHEAPFKHHHWINHPKDRNILLGIGVDYAVTLAWRGDSNGILHYSDASATHRNEPESPLVATPAGMDQRIRKVQVSSDGKYIFVEVREADQNNPSDTCDPFLLCLDNALYNGQISRTSIAELQAAFSVSLGFLTDDDALSPGPAPRSSATNLLGGRRSSQRQHGKHVLTFIDHEYWMCTLALSPSEGRSRRIRRHFFLPRDWRSVESLELAFVDEDGVFFCPSNGSVAVVEGGFVHEWV